MPVLFCTAAWRLRAHFIYFLRCSQSQLSPAHLRDELGLTPFRTIGKNHKGRRPIKALWLAEQISGYGVPTAWLDGISERSLLLSNAGYEHPDFFLVGDVVWPDKLHQIFFLEVLDRDVDVDCRYNREQ
jgi:hypothetical protein